MATSVTQLATLASATDANSYEMTVSATPSANQLFLIAVMSATGSGADAAVPVVTNTMGVTFAQVTGATRVGAARRRTTWFVASGAATTGTVTFDFEGVTQTMCRAKLVEVSGIDLTGTDQDAIVQVAHDLTANSATPTMSFGSAFTNAINCAIAAWGIQGNRTFTAGSEFTEIGAELASSEGHTLAGEWRDGEPTSGVVDATLNSAEQCVVVALELAAAVDNDTLSFTGQPSTAVEGVVISPDVEVTSSDTGFTGNVTLTLETPGGATLGGTTTVAAVAGVATFDDLEIDIPGTYSLLANAAGHDEVESSPFDITLEPATHVFFFVEPTETQVDAIISPAVVIRARNSENVVDTNYTANVVLAIQTNPGTGVLGGTLTKAAVAGVATFDDLTIDEVGNGYVLRASSGALTVDDSGAFNIIESPTPPSSTRAFSIRMGAPLTMRL